MKVTHPNFSPVSWFNWLREREIYAWEEGRRYTLFHNASNLQRMKDENRRLRLKLKEVGIDA